MHDKESKAVARLVEEIAGTITGACIFSGLMVMYISPEVIILINALVTGVSVGISMSGYFKRRYS